MLKSYSVQRLNYISKKKKIWCFGCGKRLNDVLDLYGGEPFIGRISLLLDNNRALWKKRKRVGEREIPIASPDAAISRGSERVILLITSDSYEEIYASISDALRTRGMDCSRYPAVYYAYCVLLRRICGWLPIRRRMLFQGGSEPHENAKALAEYLLKRRHGKPYGLVFAVEDEEIGSGGLRDGEPPGIVFIERNALKRRNGFGRNLKYCFYAATSRYIFYENESPGKVRDGQTLVFLNHGTIPLKNVSDVLRQPRQVDYALCPSPGCADIYKRQYGIPGEKLLFAMPPRDDFLKRGAGKLKRVIDDGGRQVIMWLPTFRKLTGTDREDSAAGSGLSLIAPAGELEELNRRLRDNGQLLLIKEHPRERQRMSMDLGHDCIRLISEEDLKAADAVLQEVLGGTAALITDYSGISFEYLLLDRPIGYVVHDMKDYARGFAFENFLDYMPGPKIHTVEELKRFLDDVRDGKDQFRERRKNLMERLFQGNQRKSGSEELIRRLEESAGHQSEYGKRGRTDGWISGNSFVRN